MKNIEKIKGKSLLFLVSAILLLCIGFILIGCGSDSKRKISNPFEGAHAIDFTVCPGIACMVAFDSSSFTDADTKDRYSIQGTEFTMEAWVMPKSSSTVSFFTRIGARGAALVLANITGTPTEVKPEFKIRRVVTSATGTDGTSTVEYIVSSSTDIALNAWAHIAGIFVNRDHSGTDTCTGPHLDIYVNGTASGCITTLGGTSFDGDADDEAHKVDSSDSTDILGYAHNPADGSLSFGLEGAIEETRLWTVIRDVTTCKDEELGNNSGDCGRINDNLISYVRFNEGEGHTVTDLAGLGSGTAEYQSADVADCPPEGFCEWDTGWIAGKDGLTAAD